VVTGGSFWGHGGGRRGPSFTSKIDQKPKTESPDRTELLLVDFACTQRRLRSLRCSAPNHDLAHLDTNSLANLVASSMLAQRP
jgi:hypothetical protein